MILTIRIRLMSETHTAVKKIMEHIGSALSHTTFEVLSWKVEKEE